MDSLEGMPEFTKPEEKIPLVVPDTTPLKPHYCHGTTKAGKPCTFPHTKTSNYCITHDPAITDEKRLEWKRKPKVYTKPMGDHSHADKPKFKTREEVLAILSRRLDVWMNQFGDVMKAEVDQAICELCKTYAAVYRVESKDGEDATAKGWRMKGVG